MRRLFLAAIFLGITAPLVLANTDDGPKLHNANVDLSDRVSLQNGAKLFVNYCVSCHSAAFMRYNRIATDLGIPEELVKSNLMFTTDKIGDTMTVAMRPPDAEQWFGIQPPDLSVIARARGEDWLYSFLQGFYVDPSRPTGVNNLYLPGVAMPHVLWELQGQRAAVFADQADPHEHGKTINVFKGFEQLTPGTLNARQYDNAVGDLVAYLQWMGEPAQAQRFRLGVWVLLFLAVFTLFAWRLNASYWKDVK